MRLLDQILGYWRNGGPAMYPIALVSVGVWFYFLRCRERLLTVTGTPDAFERDVAGRLRREPLPQVAAACRSTGGTLAHAVAHTLDAAQRREAAPQAFAQFEQATLAHAGHDLVILAALTSVAPLLGLLGTVGGMIATFRAVGGAAGETAGRVSVGVSQALITTQFGLMAAIPGVFAVSRLQRLTTQAKVRFASCRSHLLLALSARETPEGNHAALA